MHERHYCIFLWITCVGPAEMGLCIRFECYTAVRCRHSAQEQPAGTSGRLSAQNWRLPSIALETDLQMTHSSSLQLNLKLLIRIASLLLLTSPALAADEVEAKGAAVSVIRATKVCFADIVEVAGIVVPHDETPVRPDRAGLKVIEVLVEPGDNVTAGQVL